MSILIPQTYMLKINNNPAQFDGKPGELCNEQGEPTASYKRTALSVRIYPLKFKNPGK